MSARASKEVFSQDIANSEGKLNLMNWFVETSIELWGLTVDDNIYRKFTDLLVRKLYGTVNALCYYYAVFLL